MKAADFNDSKPSFALMKLNDTVSFFHMQMPRWLFCDRRYKGISLEAKVAYTFLLNRFQLSRMNGWVNSGGEVFVVFTRESLAEEMGVSVRKAIECFKELSSAGLIWERRLGRGYPNQIYLAAVELSEADASLHNSAPFGRPADSAGLDTAAADADMQNPQDQTCENRTSGDADPADQDLRISQSNYIEKNEKERSDTDKSRSDPQAGDRLEAILAGCGLEELPPKEAGVLQNAIERLWYAERFTVGGVELPRVKIRADLSRLHQDILTGALKKLRENTRPIRNTTAYVMAVILNSIWEEFSDELLSPELNEMNREVRRIAEQLKREGAV